jgi:serine/threonine protein kinase
VLRFLGEARAMAQITHPGITAIHDFGQDRAGNAYLVMEHLDGDSLADRLETGALELRQALEIGAQIAEALGAAHANGIVHRDLKPDNIFVLDGPPMQIKLVDFGVARPSDDGDRAGLRTATGCLVGTPAYMAPEQTYSLGVTAETDIYALGCVLFQVIGGRPVFDGSVADVIDAHRHQQAPALTAATGLPRSLSALVAQMLDKRPSQRPSSGDEVAARLRGIAADLGLRWIDPSAITDRLEVERVERAISAQRPRLVRRSEPRAVLPPPTPGAASPLAFAPTLAAEITPLPFHDNSALGTPEPFHPLGGPEVAAPPRRPDPQRGLRRLWVFVALASALGLGAWLVATML